MDGIRSTGEVKQLGDKVSMRRRLIELVMDKVSTGKGRELKWLGMRFPVGRKGSKIEGNEFSTGKKGS